MIENEQPDLNHCYASIYELVRAIPRGRVMTYGQIAALLGEVCRGPVPAIQVGRALAASERYAPDLPWWRVIGRVGEYGILRNMRLSKLQCELLAAEGIVADAQGRYSLTVYGHCP